MTHQEVLPECRDRYENVKFMLIAACSFFVFVLAIWISMDIATFNDLKKSDVEINSSRAKGRLEIEQEILDVRKEETNHFQILSVQLAQIQSSFDGFREKR